MLLLVAICSGKRASSQAHSYRYEAIDMNEYLGSLGPNEGVANG